MNRQNCENSVKGWITVLKCVFIANLIAEVKSWRHRVAGKDNIAGNYVHIMQIQSVAKYECVHEVKKLREK